MKQEDSPQTPTPAYTTAQWSATSQIPIDPALQQQQPQQQQANAYYSNYWNQYSTQQYQAYNPPQQAQSLPAPVKPAPSASSAAEQTDLAKLNDALGSAGVDLRLEEATLRPVDQFQSYSTEDRSRKQPAKPNFDSRYLGQKIRELGNKHKVSKVPEDSVNYMALALRFRLQELIQGMITASEHRTDAQFERPASFYEDGSPMWSIVVRADVAKQLAAIEKVEREEEMKIRRERKERQDQAAHAQQLAAQASGSAMAIDGAESMEEGPKKKKKKADGPGVTARNMSEDVRKKMSNAVASQAAGLSTGKYAWMNASVATPAPKTKAGSAGALSPATTTAPAASTASSWARPYVPSNKTTQATTTVREEDTRRTITMRDAMFVIEKERGHGGGRGAARGWT